MEVEVGIAGANKPGQPLQLFVGYNDATDGLGQVDEER